MKTPQGRGFGFGRYPRLGRLRYTFRTKSSATSPLSPLGIHFFATALGSLEFGTPKSKDPERQTLYKVKACNHKVHYKMVGRT